MLTFEDERCAGKPGRQRMLTLRTRTSRLLDFLSTEEASSILLFAAALVALLWVNSPFAASYERLWGTIATLDIGRLSIEHDLQHWVNEGLMTLFFLVVGLEIKREITVGELREPRKLALPAIAAVGGMVVPAAIYLALNAGGPTAGGWGIPVATDIAFALGVLTIVASRAPVSVRSFLLTLAIVDDIGAVVLIAVFYSGGIEVGWLLAAGLIVGAMALVRFVPGLRFAPYVVLGVALWIALYEAGIHPTIAGVVIGLLMPSVPSRAPSLASARRHADEAIRLPGEEGGAHWNAVADQARDAIAPLDRAEAALHPWTSRFVVPTFRPRQRGSGDRRSRHRGDRHEPRRARRVPGSGRREADRDPRWPGTTRLGAAPAGRSSPRQSGAPG